MIYPTVEQVLIIHDRLVDLFGGTKGIRDVRMLESALFRPQITFGGKELHPDIYKKAAILIHGIIKNHPFVDGNKRTGMHTGISFLEENGINTHIKRGELAQMAIKIAEDSATAEAIKDWLKENTT